MDMQDKKFDELFRSKLNGFEAEPPANVWNGIASELAPRKRNKNLTGFLSIAASVLVLVAAGVLLIPQKVDQPAEKKIAKTRQPAGKGSSNGVKIQPPIINKVEPVLANRNVAPRPLVKATENIPIKQTVKRAVEPDQSVKPDDQPVLASVSETQQEIKAVVPDATTQLTIKQPANETASFNTRPPLAESQPAGTTKPGQAIAKNKHKIHSLGDFINVVIAKVDKRPDKIIEFTNTDDDESNVTGVNLGIIKIKKAK